MKNFTFMVTEAEAGQRLDKALSNHPNILSRSQAEKLLQLELVQVNEKRQKPSYKVTLGDSISFSLPIERIQKLIAENIPLDIVFEDKDLLVINKPAGLVVHPAVGHASGTLVNALLFHTQDLSAGFNELRPGIVHRLDRDTSGLLVVAKTDVAQIALAEQFKNRTIHRIYKAVVYGLPKNIKGTVISYLDRHPTDRKRYASIKGGNPQHKGKRAVTHYQRLETSSGISVIQCKLETGRTHQIRIHLSELGHPIVGDVLYGSNGRLKSIPAVGLRQQIQSLPRIALHAAELGFVHPTTKQTLFFKASWPADLKFLSEHAGFNL